MNVEICPFCNRLPEIGRDDDGARVECSDCLTSTDYHDGVQEAVDDWNEGAIEARKSS